MITYISAVLLVLSASLYYYNMQIIKYDKESKIKEYEYLEIAENRNKISAELYFLSFIPPLNRFIDEFNKEKSTEKIKELILETNSDNYRTFRIRQVISSLSVIILFSFLFVARSSL